MASSLLFAAVVCLLATQLLAADDIRISPSDVQGPGSLQSHIDAAVQTGARRVVLAAGDYYDCALVLTAKHNGLTIESDGNARLYGGVPIAGWQKEGGLLVAPLPPALPKPVRLLIVQGQLAARARYPETGHLTHETTFPVPWMSTTEGGWKRKPTDEELLTMRYRDGDIPPTLSAANAEVTVFHMWDESCVPVQSIDRASRTFRFASKLGHPAGAFGVQRYIVWNTAEGLTREGQFYHDREKARLVYRPRPGESADNLNAVAGTVDSPIALRGTPQQPVRDITIRGIELQASTVPMVAGGFGALGYPGAIEVSNVDGCRIECVRIANVAGQGLSSGGDKNVANVTIEDCEVANCGAGGIAVGGKQITIRGNHVHDVGLFFPSAIAISRGADGTLIENNHVHDCTYSAITISSGTVRRNLIERAMTQLYDGGAIYATGGKCLIEENVCRDIGGKGGYSRAGYYLDEQCDGSIVRRNIAINVDVPLNNHMARNCLLEHNVMVNDGDLIIHAARCENYTLRGNVALSGGKLLIRGMGAYNTIKDNMVFSRSGVVEFVSLKQYSEDTKTAAPPSGFTIADPQFVDASAGDLRYREQSPARALGLPDLSGNLSR